MKIAVIGTGYVGLPAGAGFAKHGQQVTCVDIDEKKVERINNGECPIYEEDLPELLEEVVSDGRLEATTDTVSAVKNADIVLLAVGTPMDEEGNINLDYIKQASRDVMEGMKEREGYQTIVVKSTVVPGTTESLIEIFEESGKEAGEDFGVCMNPEFLREGTALNDFLQPDRIVIGELDERSGDQLEKIYSDFKAPIMRTGLKEAELIKYASNSLLATKISFINEIGNLCKELGIDVYDVADGVGLDSRIDRSFLDSGSGFGGSCLIGDEKVMIKADDETKLIRLEDFYNLYNDSIQNVEALSISEDGEMEFKQVEKASKREYSGEIYSIKTSMNKEVEVTEDHPMLVVEDKEMRVKLAGELEEGDRIPTADSIPENPTESFDLIELISESEEFDNNKVYLKSNFELSQVKTELRSSLKNYNQGFSYDKINDFIRSNYLPLEVFLEIERDLGLRRTDFRLYTSKGNTTYVPAIINSDREFWKIIGYYIAEGDINADDSGHGNTRKRIMFSFNYEGEENFVKEVEEYLEKQGIKYRTEDKETSTQICFSSRVFAHFLEDLGCGTGSYSAAIPEKAYQETEENKKALLSGLFRGDGYVEFTNHSNAVVYDYGSISQELTDGMTFLLQSLGIVPSYKTSESEKSTAPAHFLRVSSYNQIDQLKTIFQEETEQKIKQRLEEYDRIISPSSHSKGKFTTVKVKEIEKNQRDTEVYSMEVKDNHTFTTTDGLTVHNCFPKDVRALIKFAEDQGEKTEILEKTIETNVEQKTKLVELLENHYPNLNDKTVAVLGLAFKPGTDDIRQSPAIDIISELKSRGAKVRAYDPKAVENMKQKHSDINYTKSYEEALKNSDAALIVTDWPEFNEISRKDLKTMKQPLLLEGRRMNYNISKEKREGITWP